MMLVECTVNSAPQKNARHRRSFIMALNACYPLHILLHFFHLLFGHDGFFIQPLVQ